MEFDKLSKSALNCVRSWVRSLTELRRRVILWHISVLLSKNYRDITLTSIAAKMYNALLRNRIEPKIDNILRKNQNGFRRNRSTTSQILTISRILEGVRAKNLQVTLLFFDFTKAFNSIHREKMEQILLAYGLPKETVAAITILYRNTRMKVRSPDGDTEYFDMVAGVLQLEKKLDGNYSRMLQAILNKSWRQHPTRH